MSSYHIYASIPLVLAHFVLSGLDVGRYHWSDIIPDWLRVVGLLGVAVGSAVVIWAMSANKFFSSVIRLQTDRGHRVISEGPYAYVRHPGYAAFLIYFLSSMFALGSLVGGIPMVVLLYPLMKRTLSEDRFLRERLPGYGSCAEKVRFRLIPGIW